MRQNGIGRYRASYVICKGAILAMLTDVEEAHDDGLSSTFGLSLTLWIRRSLWESHYMMRWYEDII